MGFGTLFIGYFLLLNIFNYAYTDLIAALIMTLGAYKLSSVSRDFKKGFYATIPLAALGVYELINEFVSMFSPTPENPIVTGLIGILRCVILGTISYLFFTGIKNLAHEVELPRLRDKAKTSVVMLTASYLIALILEIPTLDKILSPKALAVIMLLSLVFTFAVTAYALTAIYSAYMRICMPEDLVRTEKASKFSTVNKFRENEKKRGEEYASYKVDKYQKKHKKKGHK